MPFNIKVNCLQILLLCVSNSEVYGSIEWNVDTPNAFDLNLYESSLDPELCSEQLQYIAGNTWLRLKFLDAGIRTPKGITEGNLNDLGNYHQCLAINDAQSSIHGKYCMLSVPLQQDNIQWSSLTELQRYIEPDLMSNIDEDVLRKVQEYNIQSNEIRGLDGEFSRVSSDSAFAGINFNLAVCIPKSCSSQQAIDSTLFNLTSYGFQFVENYCRLPNDKPFVAADYVAFAVFGLLGILTILSTTYDVRHSVLLKRDPITANTLYQSFSVYTNARRLTTYKSNPRTIECLDGIRVLAMVWVIIGHTYSTSTQVFIANPLDFLKWTEAPHSVLLTAGVNTVDTFFFLSGLLIVYITAGKLKRMSLIKNIHLFYLNRLLRIFPILATAVLLMASWFNHFTDGPFWLPVTLNVHNCRTFWWATLLHVQNYVHPDNMCFGHSWYLAVDTQLHILSPIILFWVLTSKRCAWISLFSAMLICLTSSTIFNAVNNFKSSPLSPGTPEENLLYTMDYYINTLTRASPFFLGMIFGYWLYTSRENKIHINKVIVMTMWTIFVAFIALNLYVTYRIQQSDWDNDIADLFINSFIRFKWSLALGWMIFACANGYGGPLNWLLSLKLWKIPSRMSYAMYIFHYPLMIMMNSTALVPLYFSDGSLIFQFFAHFSMTIFVAFLVTVLVDAPCSILIKMMTETSRIKDCYKGSKVMFKNKHKLVHCGTEKLVEDQIETDEILLQKIPMLKADCNV